MLPFVGTCAVVLAGTLLVFAATLWAVCNVTEDPYSGFESDPNLPQQFTSGFAQQWGPTVLLVVGCVLLFTGLAWLVTE